MNELLTIAVVAGGLTHERDVSLSSGRRVEKTLREAGHHVKLLDVDGNLLQRLESMNPHIIWPLVHGATGEDGSIQDLLSLAGYTFLGSSANAARIASNKALSQSLLRHQNILTPLSFTFPQNLFREVGPCYMLDLIADKLRFPLVVKPHIGGSALGLSVVKTSSELPKAMVDCFAYGELAHIESYIEGREVTVTILDMKKGPVALRPIEIQTDGPYDYDARYFAGRAMYFNPAQISPDLEQKIIDTALTAHKTLRLQGISRIDFIISGDQPYVIDTNVAPGMTETSLAPQAIEYYSQTSGQSIQNIYTELLFTALNQ